MATQTSTPTAADLAAQVVRALGYPVTTSEAPVGTEYAECNYSAAHDHLDQRPTVVTIYGSETTLDVCRACVAYALDDFHVGTGNDPLYTKVEIATPAQPDALAEASWVHPARLAVVVDNDGREGTISVHDLVLVGTRVVVDAQTLSFDPSTEHGRAALTALRTAIDTALGGAA